MVASTPMPPPAVLSTPMSTVIKSETLSVVLGCVRMSELGIKRTVLWPPSPRAKSLAGSRPDDWHIPPSHLRMSPKSEDTSVPSVTPAINLMSRPMYVQYLILVNSIC